MPALSPYLQAAEAQAHIEELLRQADRYRFAHRAAVGPRRHVSNGRAVLVAVKDVLRHGRLMYGSRDDAPLIPPGAVCWTGGEAEVVAEAAAPGVARE